MVVLRGQLIVHRKNKGAIAGSSRSGLAQVFGGFLGFFLGGMVAERIAGALFAIECVEDFGNKFPLITVGLAGVLGWSFIVACVYLGVVLGRKSAEEGKNEEQSGKFIS